MSRQIRVRIDMLVKLDVDDHIDDDTAISNMFSDIVIEEELSGDICVLDTDIIRKELA